MKDNNTDLCSHIPQVTAGGAHRLGPANSHIFGLAISATAQKAAKPNLPKIDEKACPFEGCQFGAWTATDYVQLFSTWKEGRKPVMKVSKDEAVTAITGVHITFEPSEIQVTAPNAEYGLKPGDTESTNAVAALEEGGTLPIPHRSDKRQEISRQARELLDALNCATRKIFLLRFDLLSQEAVCFCLVLG